MKTFMSFVRKLIKSSNYHISVKIFCVMSFRFQIQCSFPPPWKIIFRKHFTTVRNVKMLAKRYKIIFYYQNWLCVKNLSKNRCRRDGSIWKKTIGMMNSRRAHIGSCPKKKNKNEKIDNWENKSTITKTETEMQSELLFFFSRPLLLHLFAKYVFWLIETKL